MKSFKIILFLLAITSSLLFFNCKNKSVEQTPALDSLQAQLQTAKNKVAEINEDKNKELLFIVDSTLSYIEKNNKDSLTKPQGFLFQDYKLVSKEIKRYNQIKSELKSNIDYSITQLEKLKNDYISNKITKEQFDAYLLLEKEEITKLVSVAIERRETLLLKYKKFDSLNPIVNQFSKNIKIK